MQSLFANLHQDFSTVNSDIELLRLRIDDTNIRATKAPS